MCSCFDGVDCDDYDNDDDGDADDDHSFGLAASTASVVIVIVVIDGRSVNISSRFACEGGLASLDVLRNVHFQFNGPAVNRKRNNLKEYTFGAHNYRSRW